MTAFAAMRHGVTGTTVPAMEEIVVTTVVASAKGAKTAVAKRLTSIPTVAAAARKMATIATEINRKPENRNDGVQPARPRCGSWRFR
jgi:hypothetical protein